MSMTRGQLLRRAMGAALGASLLGKVPAPAAVAPWTEREAAVLFGDAATTLPTGWLPCDGRTVSARAFPALAHTLKDTFGPYDEDALPLPLLPGHVIKAAHSGPHDHSALAGMAVGGYMPERIRDELAEQPWNAVVYESPPGTVLAHWDPAA